MFCDLVGSTALSARLDPEEMRDVINTYHQCVAEAVRRHNGFVAQYLGDGVVAYFGYPQAREDDVDQAVRAGLAAVKAVHDLPLGEKLKSGWVSQRGLSSLVTRRAQEEAKSAPSWEILPISRQGCKHLQNQMRYSSPTRRVAWSGHSLNAGTLESLRSRGSLIQFGSGRFSARRRRKSVSSPALDLDAFRRP